MLYNSFVHAVYAPLPSLMDNTPAPAIRGLTLDLVELPTLQRAMAPPSPSFYEPSARQASTARPTLSVQVSIHMPHEMNAKKYNAGKEGG